MHLAPTWLLKIFPRPDPNDTYDDKLEWSDFTKEMRRVKELVNRVPEADPQRQLEYVTNHFTDSEKDEFRRLGNDLLVSHLDHFMINSNYHRLEESS